MQRRWTKWNGGSWVLRRLFFVSKLFSNFFFAGLGSHVPAFCGVPGEEAAEDGAGGGGGWDS